MVTKYQLQTLGFLYFKLHFPCKLYTIMQLTHKAHLKLKYMDGHLSKKSLDNELIKNCTFLKGFIFRLKNELAIKLFTFNQWLFQNTKIWVRSINARSEIAVANEIYLQSPMVYMVYHTLHSACASIKI